LGFAIGGAFRTMAAAGGHFFLRVHEIGASGSADACAPADWPRPSGTRVEAVAGAIIAPSAAMAATILAAVAIGQTVKDARRGDTEICIRLSPSVFMDSTTLGT